MTHWYVICETLSTVQCYDCASHWKNAVCLLIATVFMCRLHCYIFVVNEINKLNHLFHRLIHKFYFGFSKKSLLYILLNIFAILVWYAR